MEALGGSFSTELTPKSVHGFITHAYTNLFGFELSQTMTDSEIILKMRFKEFYSTQLLNPLSLLMINLYFDKE